MAYIPPGRRSVGNSTAAAPQRSLQDLLNPPSAVIPALPMAEDTERKRTKKIDTLRQHELLHGLNAQQHLILQALVAEQAAVEQTVELDVRFMPAALEGPATSPAVKTQINRPDWFQHLFGFDEQSPPGNATVAECFELDDCVLTSRVNGASYRVGTFATPSLLELRNCVNDRALLNLGVNSSVEHIAVRDVFELHSRPQFAGATFMAASQFKFKLLGVPESRFCTRRRGD